MEFLSKIKKVHFIGIGGIGMSALAKLMRHEGIQVTGSDAHESKITKDLKERFGISVYIGSQRENILPDHDMVVYSPAVPDIHIERVEARDLGISEYSYPEILGKISQEKTTIVLSGTNGKTTTTAMTVEVLKHLGIDPTAIIGEYLQKYNSNFVAGQSEYFVTEACEYKSSFLNIHHDILCITNITEDHLDYFKDLAHIEQTFKTFLDNKKGRGVLVCNQKLPELQSVIKSARSLGMHMVDYSKYLLDLDITLSIPGNHNIQNAAATLGIVDALNLSVPDARSYLEKYFQGAKRRMEHVGMTKDGALLFDDYAHNPEGLAYLIEGLRNFYPEKKIIMLFEPHLYSRTRDFKKQFGEVLAKVDVLYLFPTYRAREERIPEEDFLLENYINTQLVDLRLIRQSENFKNIFDQESYGNDCIIVTAGAGDIWQKGLELKYS